MVAGLVLAVGEVRAAAPEQAPEDPPADPPPLDDYEEQAPLDVDTVLTDTSKAYLEARARLEAHPKLASSAVLDRLAVVPAPTKAERKRLMDVLAALGQPEHLPMFGKELRRAVLAADDDEAALEQAQRWTHLLVAQGSAAVGVLGGLVADQELPLAVRGELLDSLIEVTGQDQLPDLVVLVGRGHSTLRAQLRRSLSRRVAGQPEDRAVLVAALDAASASAEPPRIASLLQFRAAMSADDDAEFTERLAGLVKAPDTSFPVRVAALRGLAGQRSAAAHASLREAATRALSEQRGTQEGELVAWLALSGLPEEHARPLVVEHDLLAEGAPRLAVLGYTLAPLDPTQAWLDGSQHSPWPQVRQKALSRVEGPCPKTTIKLLSRRARPKSKDGDKDPAVARATVQAMGRCGADGYPALVDLLRAGGVDIEQRTEAARQLCKHHGARGSEAVASVLDSGPPRRLARRLVSALRFGEATPDVTAALCSAAAEDPSLASTVGQTLERLLGDTKDACR